MKIRFDLSEEERYGQLKVKDLRAVSSGKADLNTLVALMSNFMLDDDGKYMEKAEAEATLDELTLNELNSVAKVFEEAMAETAVPKANGSK